MVLFQGAIKQLVSMMAFVSVPRFNLHVSKKVMRIARLVSDGAICLADSFEFMMYHCMRLKSSDTNE